jgi:hypothetical protein
MFVVSEDIYVLFTIMKIAKENTNRRISASTSREFILNFGNFAPPGVFLEISADVPGVSLSLIRFRSCGLVQLADSYYSSVLFGWRVFAFPTTASRGGCLN